MKKHIFNNKIEIDCNYCSNAVFSGESTICAAKRQIKNGKCRKFSYNPTLREPFGENILPEYDKKEFEL